MPDFLQKIALPSPVEVVRRFAEKIPAPKIDKPDTWEATPELYAETGFFQLLYAWAFYKLKFDTLRLMAGPMNPNTKTTAWGIVGGLLTWAGDYLSSGQPLSLRGFIGALVIMVMGKLAAGEQKPA